MIGHNSPLIHKMKGHTHIQNRISLRVQQESRQAKTYYQQTLTQNYGKLRKCLKHYALSPELKMDETMEVREQREDDCLTKDRSMSAPLRPRERKVYIERKYNRELAIRAAIAAEMDSIATQKSKIRKALSEHIEGPLAKAARREVGTSKAPRNSVNPILLKAEGKGTIKKRTKHIAFF